MRTFKAGIMLWGGYLAQEWLGTKYTPFEPGLQQVIAFALIFGFVFCFWNDLADALREQRD